jgi:hypothetical protein
MNYMIKISMISISLSGVFGLHAAAEPSPKRQRLGKENAPAVLSLQDCRGLLAEGCCGGDYSQLENKAPSTKIVGYNVFHARNVNVPVARQDGVAFESPKLKKDADGFDIPAPRDPSSKPAPHASERDWKTYLENKKRVADDKSRLKQQQRRKETAAMIGGVKNLVGMKTYRG